ncbi:uncharacterized protein B0I36DRAFT_351657 [Microdochium trichocladiopsis]|uniref:Uncharacterized protein n=1 Tax=Microdochium trichocladiopsis TaxID=1682393 RepID=A0A9P8Y1X5_9PEZI|nr:uncharacterized protein B0I36DRAFT_351657 [Microdochium trichocladiopsis]KAH7025672.1 hypothetical protein B0I36DRAFT_351657 [Microdochium trichocladiopsis]
MCKAEEACSDSDKAVSVSHLQQERQLTSACVRKAWDCEGFSPSPVSLRLVSQAGQALAHKKAKFAPILCLSGQGCPSSPQARGRTAWVAHPPPKQLDPVTGSIQGPRRSCIAANTNTAHAGTMSATVLDWLHHMRRGAQKYPFSAPCRPVSTSYHNSTTGDGAIR